MTTVPVPTPPDTSQAVAAVDAAAAQLGAANLDVSVRIGSPGDNGAVAQTIAGQAAAAQTAVQTANIAQTTSAQADATQVAPANVAVSIRVASPGTDGPVTQTTTADAAAQAQYQPPAAQYQAPPSAQPSAQSPEAPVTQPATAAQPPPTTTSAPSLPSVWTWNWTWTCDDITEAGITQTVDTGIHGWIWTWKLGTMCAAAPVAVLPIAPLTPQESATVISPTLPAPALPVPPQLPEVQPPQPPEPVALPVPLAATVEPLPLPEAIEPVDVPAAIPALTPLPAGSALLPPRRLDLPPSGARHQPLPWLTAEVSIPVPSHEAPPARRHAQSAPQPRAKETAPLHVLAFPPLPVSGSAAGGTGGGGSGVVAALAAWMLLQLPGLAVLRLPPSRRSPRARVDDIRNRPG